VQRAVHISGDDWTSINDIGRTFSRRRLTLAEYLEVEAKYLSVLTSFSAEASIEFLHAHDVESWADPRIVGEGRRLSLFEAIEVVRAMLRNLGWCRLKACLCWQAVGRSPETTVLAPGSASQGNVGHGPRRQDPDRPGFAFGVLDQS
jgi:hypothetical protein